MLVYYRRQSILVLGLLDQFNFYDQYRPRTFPTVGKTIYYTAFLLLIYSFSFSIQLFIFHKSPGTGVGNALIPTLSLSLDRIQYLWTVNRFFYGPLPIPKFPFKLTFYLFKSISTKSMRKDWNFKVRATSREFGPTR